MSINELQDEIIEEFTSLDDWTSRYELLVEYGKSLRPLPDEERVEKNRIDGCQSSVWLTAHMEGENLIFAGESDAILVRGIVALLVHVLSGHTPTEILNAKLYFIDAIQLQAHLSPTRTNGLVSMLKQMKLYALAYQAK